MQNEGTIINTQSLQDDGKCQVSVFSDQTDRAEMDVWYIFRYKMLTKTLRDYFLQHNSKIFFPCSNISKFHAATTHAKNLKSAKKDKSPTSTSRVEFIERPCIPGYIFVHAPLEDAINMLRDVNLNPWKKRNCDVGENISKWEDLYYSIPHHAMERFMEIVMQYQKGIKMYDPAEIAVEQDDEVEFITGPLAGQRGFIRIENGKSGGTVIVPFMSNHDEEDEQTRRANWKRDYVLSHLCYGVEAKPSEFRIVRFANTARLNDCIKVARKNVDNVFEAYRHGKETEDKDRRLIKGYLLRYADAEMTTSIQKSRLAMMLYRIYTILEDRTMCIKQKKRINEDILPAYDRHIKEVRGKQRAQVVRQKEKFIHDMEVVETASLERLNLIHAQAWSKG